MHMTIDCRKGLQRSEEIARNLCGLTDHELRYRLLAKLKRNGGDRGAVVEELNVSNDVRADLIQVGSSTHGYELKARLDTLARLPKQAPAYAAVCDRCTLVTVDRHLEMAMAMLPDFWGISVLRPGRHDDVLVEIRKARRHDQQDAMALALLLRAEELLDELRGRALPAADLKGSKPKLAATLTRVASIDELRDIVRKSLVARALAQVLGRQQRADADFALFLTQRRSVRLETRDSGTY